MLQCSVLRRHIKVDDLSQERVHEREWTLRCKNVGSHQGVDCFRDRSLVEPSHGGRVERLRAGTEDGNRARDRGFRWAETRESNQHMPRDRPRDKPRDSIHVALTRRAVSRGQRVRKLAEEERIAAG
jgi:hypothetical protein